MPAEEADAVFNLTMDELRHLHEGTLVRYGLHVAEWERWMMRRGRYVGADENVDESVDEDAGA